MSNVNERYLIQARGSEIVGRSKRVPNFFGLLFLDGQKINNPYCRRMPWPGIEPTQSKQRMRIWGLVEVLSAVFVAVVVVVAAALIGLEPVAVEDLERID